MTSPFRTGSTVRYEVEVIDLGGWMNTEQSQTEIVNGIRLLCADLIEGIDQEKEGREGLGMDPLDHTSIFVEPMSVGEAVRRINEAGYATDEDSHEDEDD